MANQVLVVATTACGCNEAVFQLPVLFYEGIDYCLRGIHKQNLTLSFIEGDFQTVWGGSTVQRGCRHPRLYRWLRGLRPDWQPEQQCTDIIAACKVMYRLSGRGL